MHATKDMVDQVTVITLTGDIHSAFTEAAAHEVLMAPLAHSRVILDLSQISHLTGAGLRALLLLYRQAQCIDTAMALVGLSAELHGLMAATGFLESFEIADTVADGVRLLAEQTPRREPIHA